MRKKQGHNRSAREIIGRTYYINEKDNRKKNSTNVAEIINC